TTSLARNGLVLDRTSDGPRPATIRKHSDGSDSPSRRRHERNLSACRRRNLERSSAIIARKRRDLLGIAWRDVWQLGRDDDRRHFRNGRALTGYKRGARCRCSVARSSRHRGIRLNRASDHFGIGATVVGAAKQSSTLVSGHAELLRTQKRRRPQPHQSAWGQERESRVMLPYGRCGPIAGVCHPCRFASDRVRPAFRECQRRCREGPPLALARPGSPLGLNAVADQARAERRYQYSAYAVASVGDLVRLRVDEQRLADTEPGER